MKHNFAINERKISAFVRNSAKMIFATLLIICSISKTFGIATVTKPTGGTSVTADNAENAVSPAFTSIGNIIITEGLATDFSIGTNLSFTVIAPSGWKFDAASPVTATAAPGGDITAITVSSSTASLITITMTIGGNTHMDVMTISGVRVRCNEGGNIPSAANIVRGGTVTCLGCAGGTVLANLSQAAGAVSKLVVTLPGQTFSDSNLASTSGNTGTPTAQTAGTAFTITKIRACDQFFNVVASYSGVKTLSYSGPGNGATSPSYVTNVSFANGVSATTLTTTLKKAETASITVNDGTISGPASTAVTVNPGILSKFIVTGVGGGSIGTQITGIPFNIRIVAADVNNNPCTSGSNTFNGTVDITTNGTIAYGDGTTSNFSSGILASHTVEFSDAGSVTITATRTGGSETGTSSAFQINYPAASLDYLSPTCISPGGPTFTLSVFGTNFTGSSVVRINGTDRSTTFIDPSQLDASILASDIATNGIYDITVYIPGTGTSNPVTLTMNSSSSSYDTICQGNMFFLPDGTIATTTGTYYSSIPTTDGCDSTITTYLTVLNNPSRSEDIYICPGATYTLPDGNIMDTPGTYFSVITNATGCDSVITTNLYFNSTPTISATPTQILCYGQRGSVALNATNGTAPYVYSGNPTSNLVEGDYTYYVTDANGCMDSTLVTIDPAPDQLVLTATPTQIDCHGNTGSMDLSAVGGTGFYLFAGDPTIALTQGTYMYSVTDDNGCTDYTTAVISPAPPQLNATTSAVNTACGTSNGIVAVNVTGGTAPYSYQWDTPGGDVTPSVTALPTGTYHVDIIDNNGCTISKSATIISSNPIAVNITGTLGICPGGSTNLCATAGFASYDWSTGENTQCISATTADSITVIVTDMAGCTGSKTVVTHNSTLPSCTITGGALCPNSVLVLRAPLGYANYQWSNGIKTSTNSVRTAGTYSVTVKNTDGCASTCSYTVNSPLRTTVTKSDAKCSNEYKGSATVTASAGVTPYTYLWSNGATTSTLTQVPGGTYTVRVTDAGGCSTVSSALINTNKMTSDYSSISSNFNSTAISAGTYLWFSAVANITYTGNYPVTIRFINQNINTTGLNLVPVDARLVITNAVTTASTVFTGTEWVTTAPPNLSGNYFVAGCAYQVPVSIAPNLSSVKWRGIWTSSSSCVSKVTWKWSAAAYSSFTTNQTLIGVQPVDDYTASPYGSTDLAGTPENYKAGVTAGALGTGGSNYTGTFTSSLNRVPCSTPDVCGSVARWYGNFEENQIGENLLVNAYPNPFSEKTIIEFERLDEASHLTIEIYTVTGEKVATLFDEEIEAGTRYPVEFNAADLPNGVYFYKIRSGSDEVRGRLLLQK